MNHISASTLHGWICDTAELAILDAREEGEFGTSHLFWAVPCPLSVAERRTQTLLPGTAARVVCVDDGRGLAEQLAALLVAQGQTDVHVLDGGTKAWAEAGYVLFSGVNVPSKAFGEWVEHHFGTVSVDAPDLAAWQREGRDMVVLDSRTLEEFRRMSIPGGMSVPGGELAYRIADLVPNPETLIVVNCAGRTRSIMGAESLVQAGVPNKVVALRTGRMGTRRTDLRSRPRYTLSRRPAGQCRSGLRPCRRLCPTQRRADTGCGRIGGLRGRPQPQPVCAGCARPCRICRRTPCGQRVGARRATGASHRWLGWRAWRPYRADRR